MKKSGNIIPLFFLLFFFFGFLITSCKDGGNGSTQTPTQKNGPKTLSHSILGSYPHDTSAYTQGLTFYKGELYEGTGMEGRSRLRKVDLETGKAIKEIKLDDEYFGEGVTILRDTVYQLTWVSNVVFVYTLPDFKKVKEFRIDTEGWGITNDGTSLIVSVGSGDLYFYDPTTFTLLKKLPVTVGDEPAFNLNELEYINGYVYANQYLYPYILKINPQTGVTEARYDMDDMWSRVKQINPKVDVPNGIAYNDSTNKIYVTGKWWPELYEIQFGQ